MNTPMNTPTTLNAQKRVWIVDDDETVLMLAEDILMADGYRVETFCNPSQALETMTREQPDIIVLDVMMPGLNGFEFCSQLRTNPLGRDVPVLMATSLDDPDSVNCAYQSGATDFATKPLNWSIETHRLRYMLRAAETAQQLKSKEQETRLAKEDWERTFNSFSDVVTLMSPEMKIMRANSATATALQRPMEKIIGTHCYRLFQDADTPCPNCPILKAIETGAQVTTEKRYSTPAVDCLVTGTPVKDNEGRLLHVVHTSRDLTEQKQLENEYRHVQKMEAMGTLAGGIAHDFNNLLTVISGYAEMIKNNPHSPTLLEKCADTIFKAADRGAALSRRLLTFSRKGVAKTEKRPLQINPLIEEMEIMLQRVLHKNIIINTRFADGLEYINASSDQLHQVLMNLAVNASHAMPDGGRLTIETRNVRLEPDYCRLHPEAQPGDYILIAVSDTGHGMARQTMTRIYEPFFTTKKVGEGTGLGLSVVYGIVKSHEGHILCYSEVGVGTTFKIYLPVLQEGEAVALPQSKATLPFRGGTETILIVDDEDHIRNLVRDMLTAAGYAIITAGDGESALVRYGENRTSIDMVLMDLGMPGMGGWECLKQLRTLDPGVRVMITTGYGGEDLPERARQAGASRLIGKPYQMEELYRNVREILDASN